MAGANFLTSLKPQTLMTFILFLHSMFFLYKRSLIQELLHSLLEIFTGTINHTHQNTGWWKQKTKISHLQSTLLEFVLLLQKLVICFREYSLGECCTTNYIFDNHSKADFLHVPRLWYKLSYIHSCDFSLITNWTV